MIEELRRAMERDVKEEGESEDVLRQIRNVKPVDTRWRHHQGDLPTDF
jgi:hypothetical protein